MNFQRTVVFILWAWGFENKMLNIMIQNIKIEMIKLNKIKSNTGFNYSLNFVC